MKRFLLAPALAALVMFVFGAIYWMSPFPYRSLERATDDAVAMAAMDKVFPTTGVYLVPGMNLDEKLHEELAARGPIAEVHFIKGGIPMMNPTQLLNGYLHNFLLCLVLVVVLELSGATAGGFSRVFKVCAAIGLLHAIYQFSYSIWWHHSWSWQAVAAVYDLVAFALAGLVLAKFIGARTLGGVVRPTNVPNPT